MLFFFICLIISFFNLNNEIYHLSSALTSISQIQLFLISCISIIFYTLVLILFFRQKNKNITISEIFLYILSGSLLAGSLSYRIIYHLDNFLFNAHSILIIGSIIEEFLKLIVFIIIFYISQVQVDNLLKVLFLASILGLGFQLYEDYSYILNNIDLGFANLFSSLLYRVSNDITSHWMYTGITALGFIAFITGKISKRKCLFWLISPCILHILWNSDWNNSVLISSIISAITFSTYISAYSVISTIKN
ncbi:PrsW family intramembrane metalloprotease [Enterococcus hirae]|nr:PrsW family intramembrane metalloprotease [Enterococcus hirae]